MLKSDLMSLLRTLSNKKKKAKLLEVMQVFSRKDRKKLLAVSMIQSFLTILDLVGVALIGIVGSLSVTGIQSQQASGRIYRVLELVGLSNFRFQTQVAILGSTAILLFITKTLLSVALTKKTLQYMARKSAEIASQLTRELLSRDLQEMKQKSSQDMLFAINAGINAISIGVVGTLVMLTSDIVLFVLMSASLFVVDLKIALTSLFIFGGASLLLYGYMKSRAQTLGKEAMEKSIRVNEDLSEVINTYREAIVRDRRNWYIEKISRGKFEVAQLNSEMAFMPNVAKYVIESVMILTFMIVAAMQFATGSASSAIGTTAIFMAAASRIAPAALRIQQGAIQVKNNLSYATPALEILLEKGFKSPEIEETQKIGNLVELTGEIEVKNVTFSYVKSEKSSSSTLTEISLHIPFGSSFAIVGPSGSGKSTLIDLMLGLMSPDSGFIRIAGIDPKKILREYPGFIGYVPQNTHLFEGSIKQNIALGYEPDFFVDSQYIEVIELAQLKHFINELPNGLDTRVGENGSKISGGQRQRIGIARALITNPKILILDEATSSLDSLTEFELVKAIDSLKNFVTVIVIAHRLSTIKEMDQIAYLEKGRIKAVGKFEYLKDTVPNFMTQARLMGL